MKKIKNSLKVLLVSPEFYPYLKNGGMADVAGALPKYYADLGYEVVTVMPKYTQIKEEHKNSMTYINNYNVKLEWRNQEAQIFEKEMITEQGNKIRNIFLGNDYYFDRWNIYDEPDSGEMYAFFARAVIELLPKIDFQPDVIHCNDWTTGLIPLYLKDQYSCYDFYKNIKTVFSIHNLAYQGIYPANILPLLGLDYSYYNVDKIEFYGNISYLKAGIKYADAVTTVSETYAKEIQCPENGFSMDGILRLRSKDLYGILNGLDYEVFNPETDEYVYENYNVNSIEKRKINKEKLQQEFGLPTRPEVPIIGIASRLAYQKGFEIIREMFEEMMQMDVQFVITGSGERQYEDFFRYMKNKYPDKVGINMQFSVEKAQKIYSGADMNLMPSLYEPCGLSQMISFKYGPISIVRSVGGLADSVKQLRNDGLDGSGFVFYDFNSRALLSKVQEAVHMYYNNRQRWDEVVVRNMKLDCSWDNSAKKYLALYNKLKITLASHVNINKKIG